MAKDAFACSFAFHAVQRTIADLLCWCDEPHPEPLSNIWLAETNDGLREVFGNALRVAPEEFQRRLREAQSRCLELATLLCERPELSTVRFDAWTSPQRKRLVERIAEFRDDLRQTVMDLDEADAARMAR